MKREILFRGKLKKSNKFIYGLPTYDFRYIFNSSQVDSCDNYEVIPETVCQFTGLTDKNGTKIFEGDIVEVCGCGIASVIFNTSMASFMVLTKSKYNDGTNIHVGFEETEQDEIEVIGNIFDTPELLK